MINNRFQLENILGKGRSTVYMCFDSLVPDKKFAIKILSGKSSEEEQNSFRNEYYLLRKLNHPNIIAAYDYGTVLTLGGTEREFGIKPGDKFILLEYFEGEELAGIFLPEEDILKRILAYVGSVLYYLHQSNYIYYDLKPENILIAFHEGRPNLKFIDFGFASHIPSSGEFTARGTKEYLAPEIIKKEPVDHRVDLYAFGILIYRMIYEKFPFDTDNELQIYKSHISGVFEFPETDYNFPIESAVKKLLRKIPHERYYTCLQLLEDLEIDYSAEKKNWNIIPAFSGRNSVLQQLKNYIAGEAAGVVKVLKGPEGIGKTEILNHIEQNQSKIVRIRNSKSSSGADFAVYLINRIVYQDFVFRSLEESLVQYITLHIKPDTKDLIGQVKSIISKLSGQLDFSLLIDDLDIYDHFALEVLQNLLPILQANGVHIIVTENSDSTVADELFNNYSVINLPLLPRKALDSFIDSSYAAFFPKDKLLPLINDFIESNPGEVIKFISHLIYLKIIDFKFEGPEIVYTETERQGLKNSFKDIYKEILADCSFDELQYLKTISAMRDQYDESLIDKIVDADSEGNNLSEQLRSKNILQSSVRSIDLQFTSVSLKEFVYNSIKDKPDFHRELAESLVEIDVEQYNSEIAYQFEMGRDYESSYGYYDKLINQARELSALGTQKYLLEKVSTFKLQREAQNNVYIELAEVLADIGDYKYCLEITLKALDKELTDDQEELLTFRKAVALSNIGELEESRSILEGFNGERLGIEYVFKIKIELARIELKLNNYDKARIHCNEIIKDSRSTDFNKGQAFNILGLISLYKDNKPADALRTFLETLNYYEKSNNMVQIAAIELNIGNIYSILQKDNEAKKHWNRALQINQSIGNIDQEANILMNTGIFFFNKNIYENAIENYQRAFNIFQGTGNKLGRGLARSNLIEAHLQICEYTKALSEINLAEKTFEELAAKDELVEILFYKIKVYYVLNSPEGLHKTITELKPLIKTNDGQRVHKLHELARLYTNQLQNSINNLSHIDDLLSYFIDQDDKNTVVSLIEIKLVNIRRDPDIKELAEFLQKPNGAADNLWHTKMFSAWKNYFLALITARNSRYTKDSEIFYLNNAFNLIEDESITELTKKVLIALMEYYFKRGNKSKAGLYCEYFLSLHQHISENLTNPHLNKNYSNSQEMQTAFRLVKQLKG